MVNPEPSAPDYANCSPFDKDCPGQLEQEHAERMAAWEKQREAAASQYAAALNSYESRVQAIQEKARADIRRLASMKMPRENRGSDIRGMWISAAELFASESQRQRVLIVASDLKPDGYQTTGNIPPMTGVKVRALYLECDAPGFCSSLATDLPNLLGTRPELLSPAQSAALSSIYGFEVSR